MKIIVKDNMSKKIITVQWTERLDVAFAKMKSAKIRHLVAIDNTGYAMGIISDRDFFKAMASKNSFEPGATVKDFMSWPIEVVSSTTSLQDVARNMISKKISAYLVTDEDKPVGIITHEDLLRVLVKVLDQQELSLTEQIEGIVYQSPIGNIINILSEIGI